MSSLRIDVSRGAVPPSVAPFVPTSLSGNALWLDPSDSETVSLDGSSRVSQINDKSGNARHFAQSTPSQRPTISQLNGLDVLSFNPTNSEKLFGPSFASLAASEVFIITRKAPGTGGTLGGLWWFGSPTDGGYYPFNSLQLYDSFGSTTRPFLGTLVSSTFLEETRCYQTISTPTEYTALFDGTQFFTSGTNAVGWTSQPILGRNATTGATHYNGLIAEVIIYDRKLTLDERNSVWAYLNEKWGLSIPLQSNANIFVYGHSIVVGANASQLGVTNFAPRIRQALPTPTYSLDYLGHGGFSTADLLPLAPTEADPKIHPEKTNIFVYMGGFNGDGDPNNLANHGQMFDERRAAGWDIVISYTMWYVKIWDAAQRAAQDTFNQQLRDWVGTKLDGVVDMAVHPQFEVPWPGGEPHPTIDDNLHPNDTGHQYIADETVPVITSLYNSFGGP